MIERDFQFKISKLLLITNAIVFIILILFQFLSAFENGELMKIVKVLVPIQTVYMAAIVKFLVDNKQEKEGGTKMNKQYMLITKSIIFSRFALILGGILVKAQLGSQMDIELFLNYLLTMETLFGAYVGTIIMDLLKVSSKNPFVPKKK